MVPWRARSRWTAKERTNAPAVIPIAMKIAMRSATISAPSWIRAARRLKSPMIGFSFLQGVFSVWSPAGWPPAGLLLVSEDFFWLYSCVSSVLRAVRVDSDF